MTGLYLVKWIVCLPGSLNPYRQEGYCRTVAKPELIDFSRIPRFATPGPAGRFEDSHYRTIFQTLGPVSDTRVRGNWRFVVGQAIARVSSDVRRVYERIQPHAHSGRDLSKGSHRLCKSRRARAIRDGGAWVLLLQLSDTSCDASGRSNRCAVPLWRAYAVSHLSSVLGKSQHFPGRRICLCRHPHSVCTGSGDTAVSHSLFRPFDSAGSGSRAVLHIASNLVRSRCGVRFSVSLGLLLSRLQAAISTR